MTIVTCSKCNAEGEWHCSLPECPLPPFMVDAMAPIDYPGLTENEPLAQIKKTSMFYEPKVDMLRVSELQRLSVVKKRATIAGLDLTIILSLNDLAYDARRHWQATGKVPALADLRYMEWVQEAQTIIFKTDTILHILKSR